MFDARAAKTLAPGNHLTVDGCLGLRLTATGSTRRWVYRYKSPVDGKMKQTKLGEWPAMPPSAAIVAWEKLRQQRSSGVDPAAKKRTDRAAALAAATAQAYTVRAVCDDYLTGLEGAIADKSWRELDRLFRQDLGPLESVVAAEVKRSHCFELLQPMRSTKPVNARRLRQGLGAAWDHALDAGKLPPDTPNWWRLVLRGKLPSKGRMVGGVSQGVNKRVLDASELGKLLPWLPNFSRDVQDALTMYLWTCCRGVEIVAIERAEITREADGVWWTVPRRKLKMMRNPATVDLRVPLVGRALQVVERRLEATTGSYLFPSPGRKSVGHIQQKAIGVAVWWHMPYSETRPEYLRPRLPVSHWAPHDLRRTGRTLLASLGCPAEVGEAILGHLLPGVQGIYDRHTYNAERRLWLTRLSEHLESLPAAGR